MNLVRKDDGVIKALVGLTLVAVLFPVLTYFLSIPLGLSLFFLTPDGSSFSKSATKGLPVELFMLANFILPVRVNHGVIFAATLAIYSACLVAAWSLGISFHKAVRDALNRSFKGCTQNALLTLPMISSMLLVAILGIQKLQESSGVPTGALKFPNEFSAFFALSYSPISEEVGFRLTPIGIFMIPYLLRRLRQTRPHALLSEKIRFAITAFLLPDRCKGRVGLDTFASHGMRAISSWELILVVMTSIIFGLAHYVAGSGWGIGKISGTFLAGMALGLAYLIYGAHGSILLHWFFNYYFTAYNLASEVYSGVFSQMAVAVESWGVALGIGGWLLAISFAIHRSLKLPYPRLTKQS